MHLQHTLLLSTLALWSGSAVAQVDLPAIEGGSLLGKRLEKATRRANIDGLASDPLRAGEGQPMKPSPASDEKRSFQLGNMLDGLLGGSSGSSTPASSPTPTPGSSGSNLGLPKLPVVKKDLGGLGGLGDLGGLSSVLNEVPGLSPQDSSASPATPSTSPTPVNMKRQSLPFPNNALSWPSPTPSFRVVKKQLGELSGLESKVEGLLGMSPSSSPSAGLPLAKSRRQDEDMGQDEDFHSKERRQGLPKLPELPKLPVV